jgi:Uma2 family endonuclease
MRQSDACNSLGESEAVMSTVAAPRKGMTALRFRDWAGSPENVNRWFELVRGEVIELPVPTRRHGIICMNVARALDSYVQGRRKGYLTINDAGVILGRNPDTVRGPHVAVYDDDPSDESESGYSDVAPVLAVEVLSPSDPADYITRKLTDYLQHGVQIVWILDPERQSVTVYRPEKTPQLLQGSQKLVGEDVLPGFAYRVSDFFRLPRSGKPRSRRHGKKRSP